MGLLPIVGILILILTVLGYICGTFGRHHKEKIQLLKDQEFARSEQSQHHFSEMMEILMDIRNNQS